jgi:hypothetical protein
LKIAVGIWLVVMLTAAVVLIAANNTNPKLLPLQAKMLNLAGEPYSDGNYDIEFRIYEQPDGGTALWSERHDDVPVRSGYVNVLLGSVNALDSIAFSPPLHRNRRGPGRPFHGNETKTADHRRAVLA